MSDSSDPHHRIALIINGDRQAEEDCWLSSCVAIEWPAVVTRLEIEDHIIGIAALRNRYAASLHGVSSGHLHLPPNATLEESMPAS